jgi:hypothetical protein
MFLAALMERGRVSKDGDIATRRRSAEERGPASHERMSVASEVPFGHGETMDRLFRWNRLLLHICEQG